MGAEYPTVELPGHGGAPDWDSSKDYLTQSVDLALAHLSEPSHIVGHSFGGVVALRLGLERPDLVRSLTMIEPVFFKAAFEGNPNARRDYLEQIAPFHVAMKAGELGTAARLFSDHWNGIPWDKIRPEQQRYMTDRIPLIVAAEPSIAEDNAGLWTQIKQFEKPVLLLDGARTPKIISQIQQSLLSEFPNAQRQVIAGAGHMGPISHPKPFAEAILAFQQGH